MFCRGLFSLLLTTSPGRTPQVFALPHASLSEVSPDTYQLALRAVFDALPSAITPLPQPTSSVATAIGCRLFNLTRWEKVCPYPGSFAPTDYFSPTSPTESTALPSLISFSPFPPFFLSFLIPFARLLGSPSPPPPPSTPLFSLSFSPLVRRCDSYESVDDPRPRNRNDRCQLDPNDRYPPRLESLPRYLSSSTFSSSSSSSSFHRPPPPILTCHYDSPL